MLKHLLVNTEIKNLCILYTIIMLIMIFLHLQSRTLRILLYTWAIFPSFTYRISSSMKFRCNRGASLVKMWLHKI